MPHPEYIQQLATTIFATHGSRAQHIGSTFIAEFCSGRMAWEGQVETFVLLDHPTAKRCYAWQQGKEGAHGTTAILAGEAVHSPQMAVQRMLAEQAPGKN
jgi:hypothetical protein